MRPLVKGTVHNQAQQEASQVSVATCGWMLPQVPRRPLEGRQSGLVDGRKGGQVGGVLQHQPGDAAQLLPGRQVALEEQRHDQGVRQSDLDAVPGAAYKGPNNGGEFIGQVVQDGC